MVIVGVTETPTDLVGDGLGVGDAFILAEIVTDGVIVIVGVGDGLILGDGLGVTDTAGDDAVTDLVTDGVTVTVGLGVGLTATEDDWDTDGVILIVLDNVGDGVGVTIEGIIP